MLFLFQGGFTSAVTSRITPHFGHQLENEVREVLCGKKNQCGSQCPKSFLVSEAAKHISLLMSFNFLRYLAYSTVKLSTIINFVFTIRKIIVST